MISQDAYYQASHVSNQVRGLVCDDRSKRRLLPYINYSSTPEVPKVCFQGQSIPILGSSFRPSTLTPHFHEVGGCSSGSLVTLGHPHTELHLWLVDSSSIRAVSSSASRCRSRSHERLGVKAKCKEKCASSSIEDHLSGCGVGFDQDAGTSVSCCQESERRPVTHCEDFLKAVGSDGSCVQCDNVTMWELRSHRLCMLARQILLWAQIWLRLILIHTECLHGRYCCSLLWVISL